MFGSNTKRKILVDGIVTENVERFVYLGSTVRCEVCELKS